MKDIKTFLIGFLTCFCLFLFMGHTQHEANINGVDLDDLHEHLDEIEIWVATNNKMLLEIKYPNSIKD